MLIYDEMKANNKNVLTMCVIDETLVEITPAFKDGI